MKINLKLMKIKITIVERHRLRAGCTILLSPILHEEVEIIIRYLDHCMSALSLSLCTRMLYLSFCMLQL